jgi:hypothetical protein
MNKEKKNFPHSQFLRDLALSIIGTTISIILTFGTAHIITEREKLADGRQTAMMVIHDIEEYASAFNKMAKEEIENYNLTNYVMEHLDSLEKLSIDTLYSAAYFITNEGIDQYEIDDNIERTFQSTQDTWKNINTPSFIDEVRGYYYERRTLIKEMNHSTLFIPPIPYEELVQIAAKTWNKDFRENLEAFLREKLQLDEVRFYLARSRNREKELTERADQWKNKSERCKFLMGITDEELEQYLNTRKQHGSPLKDRQLIGQWRTIDDDPQLYDFRRNHTFSQTVIRTYPGDVYSGFIRVIIHISGRWEIKNDSLYRYYDKGRTLEIDHSGISYSPDMKDSVDRLLNEWNTYYDNDADAQKNWTHEDIIRAATLDPTGKKIELSWLGEDNQQQTSYFVKEK